MSISEATTVEPPDNRRVPLRRLGALVDERIRELQGRYRRNESSGVADLASLRRAAPGKPGNDPRIWHLTVAEIDVPAGASDDPTAEELAAHAALTLYALHQQSQPTPMHRAGQGLGAAVRALGRTTDNEKAVRRRFEALGTASTYPELMDHARGLIRQLRSAAVPLDYGRLADDLVALQDPTSAAGVRLRWGRDYHRARQPDRTAPTAAPPAAPAVQEETA